MTMRLKRFWRFLHFLHGEIPIFRVVLAIASPSPMALVTPGSLMRTAFRAGRVVMPDSIHLLRRWW